MSATEGLKRGMDAVDTGNPISVPVGEVVLGRLFNVLGEPIDNCGEVGDCALSIDGLDAKLCPTSSMANSFIAQCINVACAEYLIEHNVEVPVFSSLNCDGTEERNDKLFKKYTRMY